MNKVSKWFGPMLLGAVLAAGAFAPATSEATSTAITNVIVTSQQGADVQTWCIAGCVDADAGPLWAGAAGTVVNSPTQGGAIKALVLAQTGGFNFDTSEHTNGGNIVVCNVGTTCTMTLSVNGVNIPLALANVLNNFNADPGGTVHAEARDYVFALTGAAGGINVEIGYADNAHSGACADATGDCFPSTPFGASSSVAFFGAAGGTLGGTGGCDHGVAPCWDSGAIRITVNDTTTTTPEPGSMFLLGAGLIGLAAWNRKRGNR
jgi:hypothetical protein